MDISRRPVVREGGNDFSLPVELWIIASTDSACCALGTFKRRSMRLVKMMAGAGNQQPNSNDRDLRMTEPTDLMAIQAPSRLCRPPKRPLPLLPLHKSRTQLLNRYRMVMDGATPTNAKVNSCDRSSLSIPDAARSISTLFTGLKKR